MPQLEFWLFTGAVAGFLLGVVAVLRTRAGRDVTQHSWWPRLFIGTLLALGGASLFAAFLRADGLVPLGLSAGFLVVALFVESPRPAGSELSSMISAEEY